ncbi:MAG: molybdopterin-dependent oxidoreductase [Actinobacteria bacterium]|nr:molybdopterin-dependent oxidoreductase [Actinomycetota bacterium]MCG2808182.1 molybdopterin-dependent oxidoreductase [Coriobacteriia bacterium]
MTNNWTDMANATCFIVMGANPAENHPASMAHINKARAGANGHPKAKLVVVDPRKTRTAAQADLYVRIRPGSDIAFINGLINYIITNISGQKKTNWEAYLNQNQSRTYTNDLGTGTAVSRPRYTDAAFVIDETGFGGQPDYQRSLQSGISSLPVMAASYNAAGVDTVYNKLAEQVAPYDLTTVADICGCTEAEIVAVADAYLENSRFSSYDPATPGTILFDPKNQYYRSTTMLYAMGITQHTCGGQNVKSFATLQTLLGNMGRAGGGINALRGIHNVQGSTDMGLLYHLIPGYSANPNFTQSFGQYMDKLYGIRLSGSAYADAYNPAKYVNGLQQAGFLKMTNKFFGDIQDAGGNLVAGDMDKIYALWPKSNGNDHITMFRNMAAGITRGAVVWGQNPAITEPNQSMVRTGLENLDTLVVVDLFEQETAACKRKTGSYTYLIPSCSYVEEAGSVTNSGRVLQWRERATMPLGNSKSDIEMLLRFAKALDVAGAFSHISAVWASLSVPIVGTVYDKLYGEQYAGGWTPATGSFETAVTMANVESWAANATAPTLGTATGSEAVCEAVYRQMSANVKTPGPAGGTFWLYTLAYAGTPGTGTGGQGGDWVVANRAKSRDNRDLGQTLASDAAAQALGFADLAAYNAVKDDNLMFKNWGYAWLVNRRVLYNQSVDTPWDQADGFQGPDQVARLFVSTNSGVIDYGTTYRSVHTLKDKPDTCLVSYTAPHVLTGRFPGHVEPYETPREDLAAVWGRNTTGAAKWSCVKPDTMVATSSSGRNPAYTVDPASYPLVLTTIRCVEHFQGGPITRNNAWNVEMEPEPWVEINSIDAQALGIVTGDWVNVTTARSDSIADQQSRTDGAAGFAKGFRARVGVGLKSNQRVGQGVVAIPWHWGDRGLSTGSRANDLCIDAGDANTTIPEYKACLCNIAKIS